MDKSKGHSRYHRTQKCTRREFINKTTLSCAGAAVAAGWAYWAYSDNPVYHRPEKIYTLKDFRAQKKTPFSGIVEVKGKDADRMVQAALDRLGGIENFIQPGDKVVIKPNVAWDRTPEQAANTNPNVVKAVVRQCLEARASRVLVTDVSCNDPYRSFSRSGIEKAVLESNGQIAFPEENMFLSTDLKGEVLRIWPVFKAFIEADKIVNIPVVKHHSLSGATLSMKNWYGILGGRRNRLHQDIHTSIVDLAQAVKPTITIVDATRVLMRNGPTGGNLSDVKSTNTILAGLDEVTLDTYATKFLDLKPDQIPYLAMAEERGIGSTSLKNTVIEEIIT